MIAVYSKEEFYKTYECIRNKIEEVRQSCENMVRSVLEYQAYKDITVSISLPNFRVTNFYLDDSDCNIYFKYESYYGESGIGLLVGMNADEIWEVHEYFTKYIL